MPRAYRCADCKVVRTVKWTGRCPGCHGFFNIQITSADDGSSTERLEPVNDGQVVSLDEVAVAPMERVSTEVDGLDKILGFDRVTGIYGLAIKAGHVVQIYGEPGAGKSTVILQACRGLTKQRYKVLYIAGEESLEQIKERANRVGKFNAKFRLVKESDFDVLLDKIDEEEPEIVVVDSINMVEVDEYEIGSMAAIKIATKELVSQAKKFGFALIIVVQVNKGGDFSGPRALEHMVDTSLFMRHGFHGTRVAECKQKNRFGQTPIAAYFEMKEGGLSSYVIPEDDDDEEESKAEEKTPRKKKPRGKIAKNVSAADDPKPKSHLKSIPPDESGVHTVSSETVIPDNAKNVLSVSCDTCDAPKDKACTSDSGVREAGFHQSRVTKSKLSVVGREPPPPREEPVLPEAIDERPSFKDKPKSTKLTSKPRLKPTKKPKPKKKPPPPETRA